MTPVPLIGVPACRKYIEPHQFHAVGEKYVAAVSVAVKGLPVLIPALGEQIDRDQLLRSIDGLFLTGSPSNVEPRRYRAPRIDPDIAHDPHRDATTLPMIREAVERAVPVLAVCRGFQEMNVAFGGTLHQKAQEVDGLMDHREDKSQPLASRYAPSHEVRLTPHGVLAELAGCERLTVNSLHSQGVDRLGEALTVEATAPDGLVEAFRVTRACAFAVAVQWHPEWHVLKLPFSRVLFEAFGDACRARARSRSRHALDTAVV